MKSPTQNAAELSKMAPAAGSLVKQLIKDFDKNGGGQISLHAALTRRVSFILPNTDKLALLQKIGSQLGLVVTGSWIEVP